MMLRHWLHSGCLFARASFVAASIIATFLAHAAPAGELRVASTTTNARTQPLGIAADDLSLAWTMADQAHGARQQAYQVRVGVAPDSGATWDSGKVMSDRQIDVTLPAAEVSQGQLSS